MGQYFFVTKKQNNKKIKQIFQIYLFFSCNNKKIEKMYIKYTKYALNK